MFVEDILDVVVEFVEEEMVEVEESNEEFDEEFEVDVFIYVEDFVVYEDEVEDVDDVDNFFVDSKVIKDVGVSSIVVKFSCICVVVFKVEQDEDSLFYIEDEYVENFVVDFLCKFVSDIEGFFEDEDDIEVVLVFVRG